MNPPETIVAAMPGTVAELAAATGYPVPQVLKFITSARRDGVRVNAVMQPRDPDGLSSTIYYEGDAGLHLTEDV